MHVYAFSSLVIVLKSCNYLLLKQSARGVFVCVTGVLGAM